MKVGERMTKYEIAKNIIANNNGIARTADFNVVGLTNYDVANMCNDGFLTRIKHGFYQLASADSVSEEHMLATLIPESVVCVESALFHYGYSDFTPREWSIAVSRTIPRSKLKIEALPLKVYYVQERLLALGKREADFNGVKLSVYDRERTICDCFKYRSKLDSETFNKAINAYVADDKKNLGNLSKYAKELRVYKKVMELMEVLLNAYIGALDC